MEISQDTRTCKKCCILYPLSNFPTAGIKNGIRYIRYTCRKCYQKLKVKYEKSKANWLESYKKTCKCNQCQNNDFRVLEFHHVSDDKEFNIGDAVNRGFSRKRIMVEIKKCEVLCANCHRIETYENRNKAK